MTVHRNVGISRHVMMPGMACQDVRDGRHDALMLMAVLLTCRHWGHAHAD